MKQWWKSTIVWGALLLPVGHAVTETDWRKAVNVFCTEEAAALAIIARSGGQVPKGNQ